MNPLAKAAALLAGAAHAVVTEYRRLDAPPAPPPEPPRTEINCTGGSAERRGNYDVPEGAAGRTFGFGKDAGR